MAKSNTRRSNGKAIKGGATPTSVAASTAAHSRGPSRITSALGKSINSGAVVKAPIVAKRGANNASTGEALKRGNLSGGSALSRGNISRITALSGNTTGRVKPPTGSKGVGGPVCATTATPSPAH
jgi:hypothetical protein